jgi:hypothetical protein
MDACCFCVDQRFGVRLLGLVLITLSAFAIVAGVIFVNQVFVVSTLWKQLKDYIFTVFNRSNPYAGVCTYIGT